MPHNAYFTIMVISLFGGKTLTRQLTQSFRQASRVYPGHSLHMVAASLRIRLKGNSVCQYEPLGRHFALNDARFWISCNFRHCQTMLGIKGVFFVFAVFRNCHHSSWTTLPLHGNTKPQPKSPGLRGVRGMGTLAEVSIFEAMRLTLRSSS